MNGEEKDLTLWEITNFSDCMIQLLHFRFKKPNGTFGTCNKGAITGQSITAGNDCININDMNDSCSGSSTYISQLEFVVDHELNGKNITCVHDNGTTTIIGLINIKLNVSTLCAHTNASQDQDSTVHDHVVTLKEARFAIIIVSSSLIFLFVLVLLSIVILILYGSHKKLQSTPGPV